jgi:hypothetical protein
MANGLEIRNLGYAISKHIRFYGEEFEVVSDPFPEAGGFEVHVTTRKRLRRPRIALSVP